jgi:hypothetical protein
VPYPISAEKDGIKIKPEFMEKEKLYHCIYQDKIIVIFKDYQDVLNCYEIEEKEIVDKVKQCSNNDEVEKIFEDYIKTSKIK